MSAKSLVAVVIVGAGLGFIFASFSTSDFAAHLDRQVHSVHCSFVPGLVAADAAGSDCQTTMMSTYSSVMRDTVWGGIPISLPAMGLFAFIAFLGADILIRKRENYNDSLKILFLVSIIPAVTSLVMGFIAFSELDAACKLCIGIYFSSAVCFIGSLLALRAAKQSKLYGAVAGDAGTEEEDVPAAWTGKSLMDSLPAVAGLAAVFVAAPALAYVAVAPDHQPYITECGSLPRPQDVYDIMVPLDTNDGVEVVEILDPLCPACRAFEGRLSNASAAPKLHRKAVLFPLDKSCNWMLDSTVHPGACTVSEAMVCAPDKAADILTWAFENQERLRGEDPDNPASRHAAIDEAAHARNVKKMVSDAFPSVSRCVGLATARAKLNKSMRWAVRNRIPLVTPQVYIDRIRLCGEDTDLGLDFALAKFLDMKAKGTLPKPPILPEPPALEQTEPLPDMPTPSDVPSEAPDGLGLPDDMGEGEADEAPEGEQAPSGLPGLPIPEPVDDAADAPVGAEGQAEDGGQAEDTGADNAKVAPDAAPSADIPTEEPSPNDEEAQQGGAL